MSDTNTEIHKSGISTGAGVAIAGLWLAAAFVTITLIYFILGSAPTDSANVGFWGYVIVLLIMFSPLIVAYNVTKMILGKDD